MEFLKLLKTNQTVWTLREIALILRIPPERVRAKVFRWCQKGLLRKIRKGIYVRTDTDYNRLEVAVRVFTPSYISFDTALFLHNLIDQGTWNVVTVASYLTREITIDGWVLKAFTLKKDILYSFEEILSSDRHGFGDFTLASPERALLDTLYIFGDCDLRYTNRLSFKKILKLLTIYFKSEQIRKKYLTKVEEILGGVKK